VLSAAMQYQNKAIVKHHHHPGFYSGILSEQIFRIFYAPGDITAAEWKTRKCSVTIFSSLSRPSVMTDISDRNILFFKIERHLIYLCE
jgi:hypothetical protein